MARRISDKAKMLFSMTLLFLLFGALLFFLDLMQVRDIRAGGDLPFTLWTMLTLACLLVGTLILANNGFAAIQKELEECRQQMEKTSRALEEAHTNFNETVERRTFEISVINASLNREIAERIQAEEESKKLQRRMELILDSAGEGIFGLDTEGKITFTNKAAAKMLGWEPGDLIGQSHHEMVHHSNADGTPKELKTCPIYESFKEGKRNFTPNDIFWTKLGTFFHVEYVSTPIIEHKRLVGAVVIFSDISQRIQAEEERKKLQHQMELILESAGEGIFGLDTDGRVTFANKAAGLMLGWTPEELAGRPYHELVHHTHADGSPYPVEECPIYMAYKDGKVHFRSDDVFWNKEGESFPVEYISTPIMEDGRLTGAVVVFRDLNVFNE